MQNLFEVHETYCVVIWTPIQSGIVIAVDSRCVCGCVRLGVAGGSQYTMSYEPPCGLAVLLGRPVPHQSHEFVI